MPYARGLPLARSLLLAGLLLAGPLGGLAQPAAALEEPGEGAAIRFNRADASYLEGENVHLYLTGFQDQNTIVRVRCLECPDSNRTYEAQAREHLVFPRDFTSGGANAVEDQQPAWQGTWRVSLHPYGAPASTLERHFFVHLVNAYAFSNGTASPSETLRFRSTGHLDRESVVFELQHLTADGVYRTRWTSTVQALAGVAQWSWRIPLEETERLRCGEGASGHCWEYRVRVHSGSKAEEVESFVVEPARFQLTLVDGPASALGGKVASPVNRSSNETVLLAVRYPDGTPVTPDHLRQAVRNPDGLLSFTLEKVRNTPQERVLAFWELTSEYDRFAMLWKTNWTLPKNETLSDATYRFVLEPAKDRWGNSAPRSAVAHFTAQPATLVPRVEFVPRFMERTAGAFVDLRIEYLDGSPFTPQDNASEFEAWFTCVDGELPRDACHRPDQRYRVTPTYVEDGTWRFTYPFPKSYPNVGREHQFHLERSSDQWNNQIEGVDPKNRITIVPANPRIDLKTFVGREMRDAETGFTRDDVVNVDARITYPDGTPFNGTLNRHGGSELVLVVDRMTEDGAVSSQQDVVLRNIDENSGRWTGSFAIARTRESAPVGNWTLRLHVEDTVAERPNHNTTEVVRAVHPLPIQVIPRSQPGFRDDAHCDIVCVEVGDTTKFSFLLRYTNGDPVPEAVVGSALRVDVARYDRDADTFRESVSGNLLPAFDGREWTVEWTVPREVFDRELAFRVQGTDRHDNPVLDQSGSRVFETYTKPTSRIVVTNPVDRVERGRTVYAVFDGLDGDTGLDGSGNATITLERWDPGEGRWVPETRDVRDTETSGPDHVARWNPPTTATLGEYHFVLQGRDSTYRELRATTRSFEVWPTNVTRPLLTLPPDVAAKGSVLTFSFARVPGDRVVGSETRFNGALVEPGEPRIIAVHQVLPDRFNVTLRVPPEAQTGNYSLRLRGFDLYGNLITVDTPQVSVFPSRLDGQVLANPPRIMPRSETATFSFGLRFPDGRTFQPEELPRVLVMNASGLVAEANVTRKDLTLVAEWQPDPDTSLTDHWFEMAGQDDAGNVLPAFRSNPFRVVGGDFTRTIAEGPGAPGRTSRNVVERLGDLRVAVASQPTDTFVAAELRYLGSISQASEVLAGNNVEGTPIGQLPHEIDPATGQYVVNWRPDLSTPLGYYRIVFEGEDVHGNAFHADTLPFRVDAVGLIVNFRVTPRQTEFEPGAQVEYGFTVQYTSRSGNNMMTPAVGTPSVNMEWNGQPVLPRPEVRYDAAAGYWVAAWSVPESFPKGRYELVVQGEDDEGNAISRGRSGAFEYEPSFIQSFTKVVPGSASLGSLLAFVLAAAILGRRTVKTCPNRK